MANNRCWILHIRTFKKHYKAITFDSRSLGKTGGCGKPYTVRTVADDTVGLMDHLGLDRAHVLGLSMGGMIAQEIAINYPERVNKLVLASTSPGGWEEHEAHPDILRVMGVNDSYRADSFSADDFRSMNTLKYISTIISVAFSKRLYRMICVPVGTLYLRLAASGMEGIIQQIEAMADYDTRDRLHMIQAPTLVMTGTEDRLVPPRHSEVMASAIPNAKLVKVDGGSHALLVEMRKRFNKEILDFLRDS
jgi:pimeloyl-ACP methyl ester carboxylesterase